MGVDYRIVSIGTLSRNNFWGENQEVRTPHATTTLVVSGTEKILVDPALPSQVLDARLYERAGIRIADITAVFLTTFRAAHRGALAGFEKARWFLHESEKKYVKKYLEEIARRGTCGGTDHDHHPSHPDEKELVAHDLQLLDRCEPPPEKLADQVGIFPSPGVSPGGCSLLLTPPVGTVVVAGDAVINVEYLEHGKVWEHSADLKQAQQSLRDILEIADVIVPGHDNVIPLMGKLM